MQLLNVMETAQAANHAKGEFLENLSHEVRTAISSVIGMTDAVLDTELKPEQRGDLIAVKNSAAALLKAIDVALDYFKIADR